MDATINPDLATPCGSFCGECKYYRKSCAGCGHVKGKPFWENADSTRAQKRGMLSIAVYARNSHATISCQLMTLLKEHGESSTGLDSLLIEGR